MHLHVMYEEVPGCWVDGWSTVVVMRKWVRCDGGEGGGGEGGGGGEAGAPAPRTGGPLL